MTFTINAITLLGLFTIRTRSTMGVYTFTNEIKSPVSASRIFNALTLDPDTIVKKIVPRAVKNIKVIQGNGGPGTIKHIDFLEGKSVSAICCHMYIKLHTIIFMFPLFIVCPQVDLLSM